MTNAPTPRRAYRVELDAYAGPLDLLLFLVKRHEIDLQDLPLAKLTEQYLDHLKVIQFLDVEAAGEFLVMAATLLEIKSQMLIPQVVDPDDAKEQESADERDTKNPADPRYELVQQLLAYKRFKEAAIALEHRHDDWSTRHAVRPKSASADHDAADRPETADLLELDLEDIHVLNLCEAFSRIIDSIGQAHVHEITYDDTPVSLHAEDIHDRLKRDGPMTLQEIFVGRKTRSEMIGLFLALLELVRSRHVRVRQDRIGGAIRLGPAPQTQDEGLVDANAEATDWHDPQTGEMQYDWPDEEARQRSEKRKQLRAARLAAMRDGKSVDDIDAEDKFQGLDEEELEI